MPKNEGLAGVVLELLCDHLLKDPEFEELCQQDEGNAPGLIKQRGKIIEDTDYSFEIEYGSVIGRGYDTHRLSKEDYERAIKEISARSLISSGSRGSYSWFLMEKPEPSPAA